MEILSINSLVEFYKVSKEIKYVDSAEKSILFLINNMFDKNILNATYKDGKSHLNAYLDDYAFLINSVLNFLSVRWNDELFKKIIVLADLLIEKFLEFFMTEDFILLQKIMKNLYKNLNQQPMKLTHLGIALLQKF